MEAGYPPRWGPCPTGHYCPEGTAYPFPCPIGTYNDATYQDDPTDCKACDDGYYGETTGLSVSTCTGKCAAGFFCYFKGQGETVGATVHSPESVTDPSDSSIVFGNRCAEGTYCEEGVFAETPCETGTYNPNKGQKECLICPIGSFCPEGAIEPTICPVGFYCEEGTGSVENVSSGNDEPSTKCPAGQYQPEEGRDYCLTCPPGYYCQTEGLSAIVDAMKCSAGHWCKSSSVTPTPFSKSYGDQCQAGTYCDEGSAYEHDCPPGYACPNAGMQMTDLTDSGTFSNTQYFCSEGYFCASAATTTTPSILAEGGGICPAGHYCPSPDPENSNESGTHVPHPCEPGTYRQSTGGYTLLDDSGGTGC